MINVNIKTTNVNDTVYLSLSINTQSSDLKITHPVRVRCYNCTVTRVLPGRRGFSDSPEKGFSAPETKRSRMLEIKSQYLFISEQ